MLNISSQYTDRNAKLLLCGRAVVLLLATLMMTLSLQLNTDAGTNQVLFDGDALKDTGSFAVKLQDTLAPVSTAIVTQLSGETQQLLREYDGISTPSLELQDALLEDLNRLIQARSLYDAQRFADIQLNEQTQTRIAQNPQSGEALVRLNRCLLADAYPHEIASLDEQQTLTPPKGIEICKENLRQIKIARENYRVSNADTDPQWLSELSPKYLDNKTLLCPADATMGDPGVLTQGAADPTLPCSYLYETRPSEKAGQELLLGHEGDMRPIVRCEHHLLNLSLGGKLYYSGPQRRIYTSNRTEISLLVDFMQDLQRQLGENFLKTQEGREKLKRETEQLVIKQLVPKIISNLEREVYSQLEAQLGKRLLKTRMGVDILKQVLETTFGILEEKLHVHLKSQLGEEFLRTQEGQDILQQLSMLMAP